jgi:hypothetical protein
VLSHHNTSSPKYRRHERDIARDCRFSQKIATCDSFLVVPGLRVDAQHAQKCRCDCYGTKGIRARIFLTPRQSARLQEALSARIAGTTQAGPFAPQLLALHCNDCDSCVCELAPHRRDPQLFKTKPSVLAAYDADRIVANAYGYARMACAEIPPGSRVVRGVQCSLMVAASTRCSESTKPEQA